MGGAYGNFYNNSYIYYFVVVVYNNLIHLQNNIKRSRSGIDVYLKQRFDLIPNLIEVTKGYMNYEENILTKITELRAEYANNKSIDATIKLNSKYNEIMLSVENYPQLKDSEQFLNLQKALSKIESQLQAARRIYNNDVTKYNTRIHVFPNNLITYLFEFKEEELFSFDGDSDVNVKF